MREHEDDKLACSIKIRFRPPVYRLIEHAAWKERLYISEWMRTCVEKHFEGLGIEIPKRMSNFERWMEECRARNAESPEPGGADVSDVGDIPSL